MEKNTEKNIILLIQEWGTISKIIRQQIERRHKEIPFTCKKKIGSILEARTMSELVQSACRSCLWAGLQRGVNICVLWVVWSPWIFTDLLLWYEKEDVVMLDGIWDTLE